jgi:hypothetical protein
MRDHSKSEPRLILDVTMPPDLRNIRLVVTMEGGLATLVISRKGRRRTAFEAPDSLSAFDLPSWCLSMVGATFPDLGQEALWATEPDLRRRVPSRGGVFTTCVGPKTEFHRCQLLHFERANVESGNRGPMVIIKAKDHGQRFSDDTWTTIIQARSASHAERLIRRIEHSTEALFSMDENIVSIIAYNAERWVAAGVTAEQVLRFARKRGISLQQVDTEGAALSFRSTVADT